MEDNGKQKLNVDLNRLDDEDILGCACVAVMLFILFIFVMFLCYTTYKFLFT